VVAAAGRQAVDLAADAVARRRAAQPAAPQPGTPGAQLGERRAGAELATAVDLPGLVDDARRWAGDRVAALTGWRDPARQHARRVRRARRAVGVRAVGAGGLAWVTSVVGATPGIEAGELAWGGATAVVALGALGAGRRLAELRRTPPPPRPRPAARPRRLPRDCPARGPLDRLDERERVLAGLLDHLGPAGDDTRAVSADAAAALRELGARTAAVDRARRGAPADSAAGLDAAVTLLVQRLEAGVAAYEALVVTAADAVAATASLHAADPVLLARLTEATDALAGLAAGLREVARR
jgi:hypothetical protein